MSQKLLFKPANQGVIALVIAATAVTSGIVLYAVSQFGQVGKTSASDAVVTEAIAPKITALGRLEPETEVISLSAPLALDGDRVAQILVEEGDEVQAGQVVAILDSRARLQTAVLQAEKQIRVAQAKLNQVKAGAKTGDIRAQQASVERLQAQSQGDRTGQQQTIARIEAQWQGDRIAQEATIRKLEAELKNAEAEYQRYQQLYSEGAISSSAIDTRRLSVETAKEQLDEAKAVLNRINSTASKELAEAKVALNRINATSNKQISEAKATLTSIAEVRPVDVQAAQTEVEDAIASLKRATTDLEAAYIRAPQAGQILKIHTRVGEKISENGIADLAQTNQMLAVAEVYQTDIGKVKLGQQAAITSQAFGGELRGKVSQIGLQVRRQNVFSNQPGENLDSRVVEVKIRLNPEDSKKVAGFTNLQVQAAIETIQNSK
ncbi:heterocyst specific ABC-transporter, membrane fusion protein DevB [Trichormus variabilis ATCC 29413]|uniref:Heterocyst specific ABC-transporter, membrane fusion protein DevB n=2 Tax=Anabaena variabilis TaxID=264691 RepID=Q3M6Z0_TRIV2|nr:MULTISPECIES: ABC exporter membrane fusion protein [Nostocaceae]ABA23246.1 heterocyst specific ABC-transporter, membrane fusion protein DevB [Trichormus variabilis ATCC 29413]MBC1212769.1 ABC exporter membrane fusion protein [Trichormus variabilis ARAD]MBC1254631.1 ABC exporter membrane fusion protein [Trichormus variabilis V5]MBC1266179.1 ABC exporter membrane fusion protein [Trichormus variabilis FSR]MBC1301421.1 ABC exporter membrane fusion protein [Trichormus variabilis N2B]